jgi:hypothetical protein
MPTIQLLVTVEVCHVRGKFASNEELAEKLKEEIEQADPGTIDTDSEAEYAVESFTVEQHEEKK